MEEVRMVTVPRGKLNHLLAGPRNGIKPIATTKDAKNPVAFAKSLCGKHRIYEILPPSGGENNHICGHCWEKWKALPEAAGEEG